MWAKSSVGAGMEEEGGEVREECGLGVSCDSRQKGVLKREEEDERVWETD